MNEKKSSAKSSQKKQPKIKPEPDIPLEPPQESNYNPHTEMDGPIGKLWELLRRNPWFRECASESSKLNLTKRAGKQQFNARFYKLDTQNPFAGFALRWLFKPKKRVFNFPRLPKNKYGLMALGFPWIIEEWQSMLEMLEYITVAENKGKTFAGPLTVLPSSFCLDTPWPQTPELFQLIFRWLWQDFETDYLKRTVEKEHDGKIQTVEFDGGVKSNAELHFRCGEVLEHDIIYGGNMPAVLLQAGDFFRKHKVFAVPRTMMTRNFEKQIKTKFAELLANMRFIDIRKYHSFLGNENDWMTFDYCYPRIDYEIDPGRLDHKPLRTRFGKAITDLIKANNESGRWKKEAKWDTIAKNHYEKMEARMYAVFPVFDFARLLKIEIDVDSNEQVSNMSVAALHGAHVKLNAITTPFPIERTESK